MKIPELNISVCTLYTNGASGICFHLIEIMDMENTANFGEMTTLVLFKFAYVPKAKKKFTFKLFIKY